MPVNNSDLLKVSKPLRYTGGELGSIRKDHKGRLKFCLTFPDIYEIGMSHLGFRILYSSLNECDDIACERFFAPWPDAWQKLGTDIMVSLESHLPLISFDVIGFSFQYEMSYVTALQILKRSGISLRSEDRGENSPLVIAGGGCVANPAPLKDFIDVFFIGEMDVWLSSVMDDLRKIRYEGKTRRQQLEFLNGFPFTYVPSVEPDKRVVREIHAGFSGTVSNKSPMVPLMQVVQDRVTVELSRGCTAGCRFCQAGVIYRPVREKGVSNLCRESIDALNKTGYQEMSLLSLDSGDYTQIEPLLDNLGTALNPRQISLSLPSLRAETVNKKLLEKIGAVRRGGFTIAPEAGTQRLRDIINKNLTENEIINASVFAKNAGYNAVKLYFMCGLPYETDEDIAGIAVLVKKIREATRGGRFFDITVSVSNFVPKPHTVFERFPQNEVEEFYRKHGILKEALKKEKVKLKFHDPHTSAIEAALSRGGSELGRVLERAVEDGFYLEAWSEFFVRANWYRLFEDCGVALGEFAGRAYEQDDMLPWSMIDTGLDRKWMKRELEKAIRCETTADCRKGECSGCGVCDFDRIINDFAVDEDFEAVNDSKLHIYRRYRLLYEKKGTAAFMSALDTVRIFLHMLLSSGISMKFSEGFNPQPRIVLPAPLPVGVSGDAEPAYFEADLMGMTRDELLETLNRNAFDGIKILLIDETPWPKDLSSFTMGFQFDAHSFDFIMNAIKDGRACYEKIDKRGQPKLVELSDYLLSIDSNNFTLELSFTNKGGFHFPEFFRRAEYNGESGITRKWIRPS